MNHKRKQAAVKKYAPLYESGLTTDELRDQLAADKFSDDEIKVVLDALIKNEAGEQEKNDPPAPSKPPTPAEPKKPAHPTENAAGPYRVYELWRVEGVKTEQLDPATRQQISVFTGFQAIVKIRDRVKIEPSVAEAINAQSHNSSQRYYPAGTVTNGDIEKIDLTTY